METVNKVGSDLTVGYYYHIEAEFEPGTGTRVPSHIGPFLTELARQSGGVVFYAHESGPSEVNDFVLADPRIRTVNLGPRRSAPALSVLPRPTLRNFRPQEHGVDVMVIRGPTPLLPPLRKASGSIPVALQLVGDPANETPQTFFPWWRNQLIRLWRRFYLYKQDRAARGALVLAKSAAICSRKGRPFPAGVVVFTSTLSAGEVRSATSARTDWNPEKGRAEAVRLLYTGRIVKDKGLFEAVDAVAELSKRGINIEFHIVGWSHGKDQTARQLVDRARALGIEDSIKFGGYKPAGAELLKVYSDADIYVFPTYGEGGVSRAIIEAMAVGLPVITTRIPAVEGLLKDGENVLLVEPESTGPLVEAVELLVKNARCRSEIASRGRDWAKDLTIEKSCELMLTHLREWIDR